MMKQSKKRRITTLTIISWLVLFPLSLQARYIFVDNAIPSSGDGSESAPYRTIQEGLEIVAPGDTILIRGSLLGKTYNETPNFRTHGTIWQPITLRSYPHEKVIIAHSSKIFFDKNFQIIDGLIFDHLNQATDALSWSGNHCVMRNCELKNGTRDGLDFAGGATSNIVEHCTIHDFKVINPRGDCHGIVTSQPFYDLKILNNTIYDCSGDCVQTHTLNPEESLTSVSSNLLIQGNVFYSTLGANCENALDFKDGSRIIIRGNDMHGFTANKTVVAQQYHKEILLEGNRIHDGSEGIEIRGEPAGVIQSNISLLRNEIYNFSFYGIKLDGVENATVCHNTISKASGRSFFTEKSGVRNGKFHNNLIHQSGAAYSSGTFVATASHNGWFNSAASKFAGLNDISGIDPHFVGVTNFNLKSSSPCIDKGRTVGLAWAGLAPDLGAQEFGFSGSMDGRIRVVASVPVAVEGSSDSGTFMLTCNPAPSSNLQVKFSLTGNATRGNDYSNIPLAATFPAGVTSIPITIIPVNDSLTEGREVVVLTLLSDPAYEIGPESEAQIIIWDEDANETPEVTVTASNPIASEPSNAGTFLISRIPGTSGNLTVNYSIGGKAINGVDYITLSGSVVIPSGKSSVQVVVTPKDDVVSEGKEPVLMFLESGSGYQIGKDYLAEVTLLDDEPPPVNISVLDGSASENLGDTGAFSIFLSEERALPVIVQYVVSGTAENGADYEQFSGSVTIPAGTTAVTVEVLPIRDSLKESSETVTLTLVDTTEYELGTSITATVNLADLVQSTLFASSGVAASEPDVVGSLRISRGLPYTYAVEVYYVVSGTASNGVDYVDFSGFVTLPAGYGSVSVPIEALDDGLKEGTETVTLTLLDNPGYFVSTTGRTATQIIMDDEVQNVSLIYDNIFDLFAYEPNDSSKVRFTRTGDISSPLVVKYKVGGVASNGVDFAFLPGSFTIPAGTNAATETVTALSDNLLEGQESVVFTLLLSATTEYGMGVTTNTTLYIRDPLPVVEVKASDNIASEAANSNTGAFLITRDQTNSSLTVYFTMSGTATSGTDYTAPASSVTMNAGVSNMTVLIRPKVDAATEGSEIAILTISPSSLYALNNSNNATVTIFDQIPSSIDITPNLVTVSPSATQQFAAVLKDQFGDFINNQSTFSWSVNGGGSVNSSGLFTAGSQFGGPFSIIASTLSLSGSAGVVVGTDSNSDGLPDEWQLQYFSSLSDPNTAPDKDPDGDQFTNLQEFKLQTVPTDRKSRLTFTAQSLNLDGDVLLQWQSISGVEYNVEWTTDFTDWTPGGTLTATSNLSSWIDTGGASSSLRRFYRIKVP